jgi:hypothetical protein
VAAVAAFVGTAALAVVLTRAPVRSDASLSSHVTGRACPTSGLEARLRAADTSGTGIQAAVGTYYMLEFTNVSHRPCSLYGYPEVSAYQDEHVTGGQIGSAAIRDTSIRPRPVMLAPGATAHAVLRIIVAGTPPAGCAQATAEELRITLPRQGLSASMPVHIPMCRQQGHASLSVQAIQARRGVPG